MVTVSVWQAAAIFATVMLVVLRGAVLCRRLVRHCRANRARWIRNGHRRSVRVIDFLFGRPPRPQVSMKIDGRAIGGVLSASLRYEREGNEAFIAFDAEAERVRTICATSGDSIERFVAGKTAS